MLTRWEVFSESSNRWTAAPQPPSQPNSWPVFQSAWILTWTPAQNQYSDNITGVCTTSGINILLPLQALQLFASNKILIANWFCQRGKEAKVKTRWLFYKFFLLIHSESHHRLNPLVVFSPAPRINEYCPSGFFCKYRCFVEAAL